MDKKIGVKKLILLVALFIIGSGIGSIIFERIILPQLSTLPMLGKIKFLDNKAPIVITRREEIRINSGINAQEVLNRTRGALVKVYPGAVSGVIATNDGLILVPAALLKSGSNFTVALERGQILPGKLLFTDELSGLGFMKIEAKDLPVLNQMQSADKNPGEPLLSVALSESLGASVRSASIYVRPVIQPSSTQARDLSRFNAFLLLEPVSSEGEPGSVIVDKDASLAGFVTVLGKEIHIVRAEDLKLALSKFLESGGKQILWPKLSVSYLILGPAQAKILGQPERHGVLLRQGTQGLETGDFVYQADGRDLNLEDGFQQFLFAKSPGEKVKLKLLRKNKELEIEITL